MGSLRKRVFKTQTATGSQRFPLLTCRHTTTFILQSIFSSLETISIKIWETPLPWHVKCSLPVAVRVSKTPVLKLPNVFEPRTIPEVNSSHVYHREQIFSNVSVVAYRQVKKENNSLLVVFRGLRTFPVKPPTIKLTGAILRANAQKYRAKL